MPQYAIKVNGKTQSVQADADTPLLYVLRDNLGLNGPKFGCGLGQCGACTVQLNGVASRSCLYPISQVGKQSITTLEGLVVNGKPGKLQQAFIDEQAVQCGYCINGMIMTSDALLKKNKKPNEAQIKQALEGNLCRCGTHQRICNAVKRCVANA
jgi:nicotinate dehydrogenase subunit A